MARIPDAMSLGQRPQPQLGGRPYVSRAGEIAAAGLADTASAIGQAAQQFAQQDDAFNFARARSALLKSESEIRKTLEEDQDWQTHESRYNEVMKAAREEASKLIRGNRSRALFEQEAESSILRGADGVRTNARRLEHQWGRSELDSLLDSNRRSALEAKDNAQRDELVIGSMDAITGARDKGYINPEQAVALRQRWAASYGEGYIDTVPSDAEKLKLLRDPKKNPAQYIDPDKRQEMIRIIENRQRVEADRRIADAERALAQAERQIASGVPASPEVWAGWARRIRGTPVEADFQGLVNAEREVQALLRQPIAEQVRTLQEREAKLMSGGGSMQDALNFNRLERAVKQNVALIQNAPLVYGEQRLGDVNEPIDLAAITDPQQQIAVASVFQERAARISGLQKSLGTGVPMKPLLPQEAATLTAMLDKASPQQAAALFAGLRDAAGSQDVFRGAMNQVAADSPVKAMAGILAAEQRELTTATHWFRPDETVTSKNAAATILEGERLLNPSKGDKSQDGKPQTKSIYLPDAAALQTEFADAVGKAFAGRPQAADAALQAVRAYYVGRASQTGRIAADNQDIDSALVREAVRATLGSVVDYNGNGEVLAPWGMSEDDFEDRAERAFAQKAKELKLPENLSPDIDTFGLSNAGADGEYAVTIGRNLLLDNRGRPVIINLKPTSPRDARGFIDRGRQ